MRHRIVFSKEADAQLEDLARTIADNTSEDVSEKYLRALLKDCFGLAFFPHRGTQRDELLPGLRTMGFRRKVTIAFRVREQTVNIVAIFHGGQDIEAYFRSYRFEE